MLRNPYITEEVRRHKEQRQKNNFLFCLHNKSEAIFKKPDILFPYNFSQDYTKINEVIVTPPKLKNQDDKHIKTNVQPTHLTPQNILLIYKAKINLLEQIKINIENLQSNEELSAYIIDIDGPYTSLFANNRQQIQEPFSCMQHKILEIININKTEIEAIYNKHLNNNLRVWLALEQKNNLSVQVERQIIDTLYISIKEEVEYALTKICANKHYNHATQIRGKATQKRYNRTYHQSEHTKNVSTGDFTAYSFCSELSELLFPRVSFSLQEFFQIKCENNQTGAYVNLVPNNKKISQCLLSHTKLAELLIKNLPKNNNQILSFANKNIIIKKHEEFVAEITKLRSAIGNIKDTTELYNSVCSFNYLERLKKDYIEPFLDQLSNQKTILETTNVTIKINEFKNNIDQNKDKFANPNAKEKTKTSDQNIIVGNKETPDKTTNNSINTSNAPENKNNTTKDSSINNLNTKLAEQKAVNASKSASCSFTEFNIEPQYTNYDYNYSKAEKSAYHISNKNLLNPYENFIIEMPNKTKQKLDHILKSSTNNALHNTFTADDLIKIAHRLGGKEINIRGSHHTFRLGNHSFIIVKHPKSGNRKLSGTYVSSFKNDLIKANVKIAINHSVSINKL